MRLSKPRPIAAYEKRILRRVLEVGSEKPPPAALMISVDRLMVHQEGDTNFHRDSLYFSDTSKSAADLVPIAIAVGAMANDARVELVVWAAGRTIARLELEAFNGARFPIRLPILESIARHPEASVASQQQVIFSPIDRGSVK
jgi:hypothetical protein